MRSLRQESNFQLAKLPIPVLCASRFEMPGLHKRSHAPASLYDALAFKLPVDLSNRVRVDAQVDGKLPHGGQLVANREFAGGYRKPDRPLELVIKRGRMRGVDVERQAHCSIVLLQ